MKVSVYVGILVGVICALAIIAIVLLAGDKARSSVVLAPRCHLADEAHLDYHPLTPDYIGRLIAQQLMDDGVAYDAVPDGYELQHAAKVVGDLCLP